jgi:hypothetical protein
MEINPMNKLSILILFLLLTSCNKDNSVDTQESKNEIWPLQVGVQWSVNSTEYDSTNKVKDNYSHTIVFTKDTIISGEQWFQAGIGTNPYGNRSDGFYCYMRGEEGILVPVLYLPYPSKNNQEYPTILWTTKVVSIDTLIKIDNASYSCYAYSRKLFADVSYNYVEYYSPGVGPIRRDVFSFTSNGDKYLSEQIIYHKLN